MKKNNKAIKKKASIFRMYGKYFLLFIVFVGILGALNDMIKNPAHRLFYKSIIYGFSYICFGIVVLMVVTYVIYEYFNLVLSFYRQTKLPLKKEEMKKLNITNPDEYLRFVDNYLPRIKPNKDIQYRVIFTSYLYLYDGDTGEEKEKILQNAFKFRKVPVCVNNYEYIYDFSNKVTVCHDKYFNELTAKLFSNEDYNSVFYEDIKN